MAAQASAPPTQVQQKVKAEIKFTAELDEILKRITEIKNIAGVIVVNSEGITVKSTLENSLSVQVRGYPYIHMYRMRANKGRSFNSKIIFLAFRLPHNKGIKIVF